MDGDSTRRTKFVRAKQRLHISCRDVPAQLKNTFPHPVDLPVDQHCSNSFYCRCLRLKLLIHPVHWVTERPQDGKQFLCYLEIHWRLRNCGQLNGKLDLDQVDTQPWPFAARNRSRFWRYSLYILCLKKVCKYNSKSSSIQKVFTCRDGCEKPEDRWHQAGSALRCRLLPWWEFDQTWYLKPFVRWKSKNGTW